MSTPSGHAGRRTRQPPTKCATRACDQCRLRKTKCSLSRPCELCVAMGFECTFMNPQKKRGPPAHRVTQIREQQHRLRKDAGRADLISITGAAHDSPPLEALNPNTLEPREQVSSPQSERQHQPSHFDNEPSKTYGNSILTTSTPSTTAWSSGADLDYWLPDTLNSQPGPVFGFPGSNIFVKETLPPIIDDVVGAGLNNLASFVTSENVLPRPGGMGALQIDFWPSYINEQSIIPWIDVYFDRLHPTLPVLNRSSLFTRIVQQEHRRNPQFGAMILSLCAFSLTQPIDISERPTSASRADQAKVLVNEAARMRTSSDFGENPSIEAVLTSFFLFGYLFGSNQHNAARLRLREAMDLAWTLGLNNPATYADCSTEEKGLWLRTYLVLSVTERAYALQRQHPISFTGRPLDVIRATDEIRNATQRLVSGIIVHTERDAAGMMGLALLMEIFDAIDEDILICWNARCNVSRNSGKCQVLTEEKALSIYRNLARVSDGSRYRYNRRENDRFDPDEHDPGVPLTRYDDLDDEIRTLRDLLFLSETQCADILVTQKWVQDRLWNLCFSHGLLSNSPDPETPELSFQYAVQNAERTLRLCRSLRISAIEVHGVGIAQIEKLYNIATSALLTAHTGTGRAVGELQAIDSLQVLAGKYLKLLQTLRGGNHPYAGPYKAQLVSLGWVGG
ncbi:CeGAL family transcription factor [Aspergillus lucknowensis]|uniref:Zn(2)-C6 fungal-type domain-containing protein n=1 Tax=Aspergillus lucknowensis TaxID=176173 RepID=A0ABR4LLK4_9EURO